MHIVLLEAVRGAERGRWALADDLLHRRSEVWERVAVRECGQSVSTHNGTELRMDFPWTSGYMVMARRKEVIAETGC